ncbi:unnamed protein product [Dibothriocephalus latus]|uniref:Uncharacterized protein n=1 Tax=Dibothriocephalus latus TaxID=60516 RepID=A0A3P6PEK4_DIBLA|nr:unnamed protein product [Dibothriocephalus latus]
MNLIGSNDSQTRKPVTEEFEEDAEEGERKKKTKAYRKGRSQAAEKRSDRRVMKMPTFHTPRLFRHKPRRSLGRTSRPLIWGQEGINLYLRLGAVVFGFGVMILDGFSVSDQFQEENYMNSCHSVLWIPKNVIHSIYIFWQTYFLFKYHRVSESIIVSSEYIVTIDFA